MRDALLDQVVHPFQELQSHRSGQPGARGVPAEVLAQGTRVAGGERNRARDHAPGIPSTLLPVSMMAFLMPFLPK